MVKKNKNKYRIFAIKRVDEKQEENLDLKGHVALEEANLNISFCELTTNYEELMWVWAKNDQYFFSIDQGARKELLSNCIQKLHNSVNLLWKYGEKTEFVWDFLNGNLPFKGSKDFIFYADKIYPFESFAILCGDEKAEFEIIKSWKTTVPIEKESVLEGFYDLPLSLTVKYNNALAHFFTIVDGKTPPLEQLINLKDLHRKKAIVDVGIYEGTGKHRFLEFDVVDGKLDMSTVHKIEPNENILNFANLVISEIPEKKEVNNPRLKP